MNLKQRHSQRGQAVPIGMALFFFLGLTTYVLFNTGQTVSDKTKIVNTADSAVYSGLLWQSRALNFTAYTNRAMVANQVAMAQAVSLHSWSGYMAKTGENLNYLFGWVPYVGTVTQIIDNIASTIDMFLTPISEGMLTVIDMLNTSIGAAQEGMYLSTFAATPDVVNSVVKSNDTNNQDLKWETAFSLAATGLNAMEWQDFTEKFEKEDTAAMRERKAIIEASTDKFTNERDWRFFNFFIPITPLNWVRFEKHGTTQLYERNGEYQWHAKDAFSLREKRYTWRGTKYRDQAIAGASSFANSTGSSASLVGRQTFFGGRHGSAQDRRQTYYHDPRGGMPNYSGIQNYRALTEEWRESDEPPTLKLRIEIALNPDNIEDSTNMTGDSETNSFVAKVDTPGDVITSVSTAELFFEKPCFNANCKEEFANSYSPYWDVRLVKTTGSERLMAYGLHGDTLSDQSHMPPKPGGSLPGYAGPTATPITDYKEQAKGVKTVIRGMENYLETLTVDSPEYQQYAAKLQGIKDSVSFDADAIADDFVQNNLQEEDVVLAITKAAGYDLDVGEFNELKAQVESVYGGLDSLRDNLSREQLESQFNTMVADAANTQIDNMKAQLQEQVSTAVQRILENMAAQYLGDLAGNFTDSDVLGNMANNAAEDLINNIGDIEVDEDDLVFDVNNECSIYNVVSDAEQEVFDLQQRLAAINQKIADDFHVELELATDLAVAERNSYVEQIGVLRQEINNPPPSMNEEDTDDYIRTRQTQIERLQLLNTEVPEKRVHELSLKLMEISDRHTAAEFDNYRLDYRFARKAVEDTLGDINVLEVDENGETVSQNLFFAEAENELDSDTDQTFTEAPEGC
jgi:hypothetical protein